MSNLPAVSRHPSARSCRRAASCVWLLALAVLCLPATLPAQSGQSGEAGQAAQTPTEIARVPTAHANVHMGPSSGQQVLVLVPRGTELPVIGRRGEWVQVRLSPELRKTGMVMRWYKNEDNGWMHDSTVEIIKK